MQFTRSFSRSSSEVYGSFPRSFFSGCYCENFLRNFPELPLGVLSASPLEVHPEFSRGFLLKVALKVHPEVSLKVNLEVLLEIPPEAPQGVLPEVYL